MNAQDLQSLPMIEVRELKKSFGPQEVLRDVSLSVRKAASLVVIGGSGCGKTVFLKILIGLMKPDSGQVFIEGQEISSLSERELIPIRKRFGMVFQGSALFDSLTAAENVAFPLREHSGLSQDEIMRIVREKLLLVGLDGVEGKYPAELSGGMRKRVALARAIALNPEILLYDEPTTGLDPATADATCDLIMKMQKTLNVTSVLVTHDMHSAFRIASTIAMLYEGRIIAEGSPEDFENSRDERVMAFAGRQ